MPPKLGQIVETILYTSDLPAMLAFYQDVLGLEPFISMPAVAGFELPNHSLLLLFDRSTTTVDKIRESGTIPKHGCPTGLGQHIAFACDGEDELKEWEAHFEEKGVGIVGRINWERGGRSVYIKDVEGHVLEIMTKGVWSVY